MSLFFQRAPLRGHRPPSRAQAFALQWQRNKPRGTHCRHLLTCLILSREHHYGAIVPPAEHKRSPELPVFWEFVQWVLYDHPDPATHDEHWSPVSVFCSPCHFNYDAIVKFESLDKEEPQLEAFLGVSKELQFQTKRKLNANAFSHGLEQEEITEKYLETLTDEDVEGLFTLYENDFRMFGYSYTFRNRTFPAE